MKRDVPDIARAFQAMGLKTELLQDVGRDGMREAVDKFGAASRGAPFAAFYFAGHGATWVRDNYLVPVDVDLGTPSIVSTLVSAAAMLQATQQAGHRLMVFDACRNNPADGWRQVEAAQAAVVGTSQAVSSAALANRLTLFSTAPGRVALDGPAGQNSPFAAALLRELDKPSVDFATLPMQMRRDLLIGTEGRQVLWDVNSIQDGFTIKGAAGKARNPGANRGNDPALIVELPNVYAYARDNRILLPPGLIAYRSSGAGRDGRMIGAYKYIQDTPGGRHPHLLIVMSVEEGQRAEVIMAGIAERGPFWRSIGSPIVGGKIEFIPRETSGRNVFEWKDARSGTIALFPSSSQAGGRIQTASFTRLDG